MSEIKYAIRYFSREGSTKKLADAIAEELGIIAYDVNEPLVDPVDVLFLGGAVYRNDLDFEFRSFIETLDSELVGEAVVFSISSGNKMPYDVVKAILDEKGIK
jgi:flavodoxin